MPDTTNLRKALSADVQVTKTQNLQPLASFPLMTTTNWQPQPANVHKPSPIVARKSSIYMDAATDLTRQTTFMRVEKVKMQDITSLKRLKRDYASRDLSTLSSLKKSQSVPVSKLMTQLNESNLKKLDTSVFRVEVEQLQAWAISQGRQSFDFPNPTEIATEVEGKDHVAVDSDRTESLIRVKLRDDDVSLHEDAWYPARQLARLKNLYNWRKTASTALEVADPVAPSPPSSRSSQLFQTSPPPSQFSHSPSPFAPQRDFVPNYFYPPTTEHRVPPTVRNLALNDADMTIQNDSVKEEVDDCFYGEFTVVCQETSVPTMEKGVETRARKRLREEQHNQPSKKRRVL